MIRINCGYKVSCRVTVYTLTCIVLSYTLAYFVTTVNSFCKTWPQNAIIISFQIFGALKKAP